MENSKLLKNEVSSNRKYKLKILTQMRRTKFHIYKIFLLSSHLDLFAKNGLLSFPSFPLIIRFSSTQFYLYPSLFLFCVTLVNPLGSHTLIFPDYFFNCGILTLLLCILSTFLWSTGLAWPLSFLSSFLSENSGLHEKLFYVINLSQADFVIGKRKISVR